MTCNYLYIIESPMQCLNALEASYAIDSEKRHNHYLLVRYSHNIRNNTQIDNILSLSSWTKIIRIRQVRWFNYLRAIAFLKTSFLKELQFQRVYIGEFRSPWMFLIANNLNSSSLFLLDDGAGTPERQVQDLDPDVPSKHYSQIHPLKRTVKSALSAIAGLKSERQRSSLNLFTVFPIKPYPRQAVELNDYKFLRSLVEQHEPSDEGGVYFIGTNLVNAKIMTETDYFSYVKNKIDEYSGHGKITYLAHRAENVEVLERYSKRFGFSYVFLNNIVEYEFIKSGIVPKALISFPSFAAYTLKIIFPRMTVDMIRVNNEYVLRPHRDNFDKSYALYDDASEC